MRNRDNMKIDIDFKELWDLYYGLVDVEERACVAQKLKSKFKLHVEVSTEAKKQKPSFDEIKTVYQAALGSIELAPILDDGFIIKSDKAYVIESDTGTKVVPLDGHTTVVDLARIAADVVKSKKSERASIIFGNEYSGLDRLAMLRVFMEQKIVIKPGVGFEFTNEEKNFIDSFAHMQATQFRLQPKEDKHSEAFSTPAL